MVLFLVDSTGCLCMDEIIFANTTKRVYRLGSWKSHSMKMHVHFIRICAFNENLHQKDVFPCYLQKTIPNMNDSEASAMQIRILLHWEYEWNKRLVIIQTNKAMKLFQEGKNIYEVGYRYGCTRTIVFVGIFLLERLAYHLIKIGCGRGEPV